jgi:ATP-dependent exoDNAse (exonuclease V) alpha subunit
VIPQDGIVVVDEAAMVDSRANARVLEVARQRNCLVIEIGDVRQLQPIDFGASFRIIREAAKAVSTYSELRDIQRQRRAWHKDAVAKLADAIVERDDTKRLALVRDALESLDERGAITWVSDRDEAIDTAVTLASRSQAAGHDTIALASDKDSVRHISEECRRREGRQGAGLRYVTAGGMREFTPGDRLIFLENSLGKSGLGVRNGDRGEVIQAKRNRITVRIDGDNDRLVSFAPSEYRAFDYANASTVHKAQGASVEAAISVIDRSASAELLFVAASRSRDSLDIVVPRSAFRSINVLSEHISDRISLKTTTRSYDELLERTGGKETIRVRNIEAQRDAAPLRKVYEFELVEPLRAILSDRIDDARENYQHLKYETANSGLPMEERLDRSRVDLSEYPTAAVY